jgi:hypothetical protein
MTSQVRYLVTFTASAGIYNAGDVAALPESDYLAEVRRRPAPVVTLLEEWHEELDANRVVIAERTRVVKPGENPHLSAEERAVIEAAPPPAPSPPDDVLEGDLERRGATPRKRKSAPAGG